TPANILCSTCSPPRSLRSWARWRAATVLGSCRLAVFYLLASALTALVAALARLHGARELSARWRRRRSAGRGGGDAVMPVVSNLWGRNDRPEAGSGVSVAAPRPVGDPR